MVSDIGGNLGLLLGASAFTLYEFLEGCVRRCWRRSRPKGGRVAAAELHDVMTANSGGGGGGAPEARLSTISHGPQLKPLTLDAGDTTQISI